jgi:hypothetical protein
MSRAKRMHLLLAVADPQRAPLALDPSAVAVARGSFMPRMMSAMPVIW